MSLLGLPTELILEIAKRLDSQASISSLRNTNNHLYTMLEDTLYIRNIIEYDSQALGWACEHDERQLAAKLLYLGANVHSEQYYYDCPLRIAIICGHIEIVRIWLAHAPELLNCTDRTEETLYKAVSNRQVEIFNLLLEDPYIDDFVIGEASGLTQAHRTPLNCALFGRIRGQRLMADPRVTDR